MAQALAQGKSVNSSYEWAGFSPHRSNASRLSALDSVQGRVAEIQGEAARLAELDIARTLKELARIGLFDPRRLIDKDGYVKQPKDWDDDVAAAVASIEVVPGGKGKKPTYKVKFWNKGDALEKIGRHQGMFATRSAVNVNYNFDKMTPDELAFEWASMLAAIREANGLDEQGKPLRLIDDSTN